MRLSTKLMSAFGGITLIITVAFSFFAYSEDVKGLHAVIEGNLLDTSEGIMVMIDHFMFERRADMKSISINPVIAARGASPNDIYARLVQRRDIQSSFQSFTYFDNDGIRVVDTDNLDVGEKFYGPPKLMSLLRQGESATASEVDLYHGLPVVYFGIPLKNDDDIFAYVVGRTPLQILNELIKSFAGERLRVGYRVDIVDRDGATLYSSVGSEYVLKKGNSVWKAVEAQFAKKSPGVFWDKDENVIYAFSDEQGYLDFKGNGWKVIISVPADIAFAEAIALRNKLILLTLVVAGFATLLAFAVARRLSNPLVKLQKASSDISEGNYNVDIEISESGEIGELAKAFRTMMLRLGEAKEKIERYTLHLEGEVQKRTIDLELKIEELDQAKNDLEKAIKDIKFKEEQLVQSEKLSAVGQMAAGIAHEINNPLTAILGYAQLIMARKDIDAMMKEELQSIERESKRCVSIIENLLGFARPLPPQKELADINMIVSTAVKLITYTAQREGIEIELRLGPDIPKLVCDQGQIQQVIINMVMNAVHAVKTGGRIVLSTGFSGKREPSNATEIVVSIEDNGVGISKEVIDKIFDPFFTTSYRSGKKGVGLGLAVSHTIVKQHGGRIVVASEVGKGTIFRIYLPMNTED